MFPAWKNSCWGALLPTVGWNFLLTGSSLPDIDGPASIAIWANVGLAMMTGIFPHPPASLLPPPTSQPPPSASSLPLSWVRASWLGMGDELERGSSVLSLLEPSWLPWSGEPTSPCLSHLFLV